MAEFEVQACVGLRGHLRACHIQQHCSYLKAQVLLYVFVKAQHSTYYTVQVTACTVSALLYKRQAGKQTQASPHSTGVGSPSTLRIER